MKMHFTRRVAPWIVVTALAALAAGCSADVLDSDATDRSTLGESLTAPGAEGTEFRGGFITPGSSADITHYRDPAICSNTESTFLLFSVDAANKFRTLYYDAGARSPSWGVYGASRTFKSKPVCTMRETGTMGGAGFVVAGKDNDNRIYASAGTMDPGVHDGTPENPTFDTAFIQVDGTTYNDGVGHPALATSNTRVALTYIGNDNKVYVRTRTLPYLTSSWGSALAGPANPTNYTPVGAPAITFLPPNYFQIVVRMRNAAGTMHRIYRTYFTGTQFSGVIPGTPANWANIPFIGTIDSDPALAYNARIGTATLYYRSGSKFRQTSGFGDELGSNALRYVESTSGQTFVGAPAALGGVRIEFGSHVVLGRTSANRLYVHESKLDELLIP